MPKYQPIEFDFNDLNHSELVLFCEWCGLPASRAIPREELLNSIYQHYTPIDFQNSIDLKRKRLSSWLKRYWERIQMQASKKVCPNCEFCRELQVLECYHANKRHIEGVK